ncbi:MBL fold metallo-hydrolase [Pandoraea communis]|uniref:MBL fold metallo-hydrolase n=1 Tax=Pandoraea communis TaxID=2508297 RepID=UPI0025A5DD13|nr:MBL fold metallo-hydrolase [Pandoraea communis]MDM8355894.1 MBL fold metallo-hydrolase [Pandoraea communis]
MKHPLTYRVGDATITRVDETTFSLPPEVLFSDWDLASEPLLAARLAPASLDIGQRRVSMRTHLWVVEINGLTVVVDTGIGNGKVRPFSALFDRLDNPVLERFAAAGFRTAQVDYVLVTHLHVDHVGWNTHWKDGRWQPVFENATYVFGQRERDFFATQEGEPRRMVFEDSVKPIIDAGQARVVPDAVCDVVEGIRLLPTPGHSVGHMAIEITSNGQTALFSGDVMHSPLQVYRPAWNSTFCRNQEEARASRAWLLDRAARTEAIVFPAHFPEGSAGRVLASSDGFEWRYVV